MLENIASWLSLNTDSIWAIEAFIVIFITLLAGHLANRILKRIEKKLTEKTASTWDEALIKAMRRPLHMLIWVLGITFAAGIAAKQTEAAIFDAIAPLRDVGVIALFSWFLLRFTKKAESSYIQSREKKGSHVDRSTTDAVSKLLRLAIIITSVLITLQTLGFSVSGVLAFGGVGGIAIGFAAKDLLANFFGAMMVYLDRPFVVGDWIRSPDKNIEGTVEAIGWRQTRIRTFDKRPIYVPNSVFSTVVVENPSRMTHRRINETIGIRYDDVSKARVIVKDVEDMLRNHEEIASDQTLMVHVNTFAASSVDFFIYTFTKTTNWQKFHVVKEDVLLKISDIIESHGAEIAFPTSTIHLPDNITKTLAS